MRALVIGRGSMGRRRIRDLTALGVEVESWDITDGPEPSWYEHDAYIVSTPPDKHAGIYRVRQPHFFEAGVVPAGGAEGGKWAPCFPSCTPLFTDWWPYVSDGPAKVSTEYWQWTGQHIDDWHPGATAETYYARRDPSLAIREMVAFELIWLTKLYGPVEVRDAHKSDTSWNIRLAHRSGVAGKLTIDVVSRPARRRFDAGVGGLSEVITLTYTERAYLEEMRAFVAAVKGEAPWPYSQAEEAANLEVLHTIERSG